MFSGEIHDAIDRRDIDKINGLIDQDPANVSEKTLGGSTPLHLAVGINNADITRLLIKRGADVNAQTREGFTPLHWAAFMNAGDAAVILLRNGADPSILNIGNETPLDIAKSEKADAVIKALSNPVPVIEVPLELAPAGDGLPVQEELPQDIEPVQIVPQPVVMPPVVDEPDKPIPVANETVLDIKEQKQKAVVATKTGTPGSTGSEEDIDQLMIRAKAAVNVMDYDSAYTLFTKLLMLDPGSEAVNFHYAMTCYNLKDFSRARLAFERVLDINPKNPKATTMLGICNFVSGQYDVAEKYFTKALTYNPPPADKIQIDNYLLEIQKGIKRWSFSARVDAGYFIDDNVNVGPDSDIVSIAPIVYGSRTFDELVLQDASLPNSANGYLLAVSVAAGYDIGGKGRWSTFGNAAYFENWMDSDASAQESLFIQGNAGFQKSTKKSMLQIPVKGASITTGNNKLMDLYGIAPVFVTMIGAQKNIQLQTAGSAEIRDYDTINSRDGYFLSAGETVKWFAGKKRHSLSGGLLFSKDFTDEPIYEYLGMSASVGFNYNMLYQSTLYAKVKYTRNGYSEKETLALETRRDDQMQYLIGVRKSFGRRSGLDISYQATDNNSTFGLYEYKRNVATISTFFTF